VAPELPGHEHAFTPYYCEGLLERARRAGLAEFTVAGEKLAGRCLDHLRGEGLTVDYRGRRGPYDLVASCSTFSPSAGDPLVLKSLAQLGDGVKRVYAGEVPQIQKLRRAKTALAESA
jgi:hypothetical protein